jgi:hypothetical protein
VDEKPHSLNYATPTEESPRRLGWLVRGVGALVAIGGVITAIAGTVGLDDKWQILTGFLIAGFGVTWAIMGEVLRIVETPR